MKKRIEIFVCALLISICFFSAMAAGNTEAVPAGMITAGEDLGNKPGPAESPENDIDGMKYILRWSFSSSGISYEAYVCGPVDKNVKSVTIPAELKVDSYKYKVIQISEGAFTGLKKLTSVTIGANIQKIEANAFSNCPKLKKITIKTTKLSANSIGKDAFKKIAEKPTFKCPSSKVNAYKKILLKKGAPKASKFTK